jgi:hypothetical protein
VPMESLNLLGFTFALALGVHQDIREEKEEEPGNQKCIQRFPHETAMETLTSMALVFSGICSLIGNSNQFFPGLMLRSLAIARMRVSCCRASMACGIIL